MQIAMETFTNGRRLSQVNISTLLIICLSLRNFLKLSVLLLHNP